MSIFSFLITFALSWWIILFMLLPIGAMSEKRIKEGHASSAPKSPMIWQKMVWATLLAAFVSFSFLYAMDKGYLDFLAIRGE